MNITRLFPLLALAGAAVLVSCNPYYPPVGMDDEAPPYPLYPTPPRDYDRYGIPPQEQGYRQPPPRYRDGEPRSYERLDGPQDGPRNYDPEPQPTEYPVAERSGEPNQVISPYPPYSKIDVTGFRSGQLAKDPKSGKIFQVP